MENTGLLRTTQPAKDKFALAALIALFLQAAAVIIFGRLGWNARIYQFFAVLSNQGIDIFDAHALPQWRLPWTYLDFTPFNLLIYKVLFLAKGRAGGMLYRAYQFAHLFLAFSCVRTLSARGCLRLAQERCLLALIAFNPPLTFITAMAEDKTYYLSLPLLVLVLADRPRIQAFMVGLWSAWTGSGLLFLPVALARYLKRHSYGLLLLLLAGLLAAGLPFFPHSLVLLHNRNDRESGPAFWFSIWRLLGRFYLWSFNKYVLFAYAFGVWLLYVLRRLTFSSALVAICFSYCLFSNNTGLSRIMTTLFLALLFIKAKKSCYLFTASVFVLEGLTVLARANKFGNSGLLSATPHSTAMLVLNVLLANGLMVIAIAVILSGMRKDVDASELAAPGSRCGEEFL